MMIGMGQNRTDEVEASTPVCPSRVVLCNVSIQVRFSFWMPPASAFAELGGSELRRMSSAT